MLKKLINQYKKQQTGDTIVEVLVAVGVVGVMIVSAFQISNQSVASLQTAQEHDQALKLAETQLEYMHNAATLFNSGTSQCYGSTGTPLPPGATGGVTNCQFDSAGKPPTAGEVTFTVTITGDDSTGNSYKVNVSWDSLLGSGKENVSLFYRSPQTS